MKTYLNFKKIRKENDSVVPCEAHGVREHV